MLKGTYFILVEPMPNKYTKALFSFGLTHFAKQYIVQYTVFVLS